MVEVRKQNGEDRTSFGVEGGAKQPRREAEGRGARGPFKPPIRRATRVEVYPRPQSRTIKAAA